MKILLLAFGFLLISGDVFSQRRAEGYIISINNDSIPVIFRLPKPMSAPISEMYGQPFDFFHLKDEVEVIDADGEVQRLTPRDIRLFAFNINSRFYKFESKPVNIYRQNFLSSQVTGPKLKLYNYTMIHQGTAYYANGMKAKGGSAPWKEYFWTLEKPDGSYLFINSRMKKREMVRMMKEFFNGGDRMKCVIDQQFHGWLVSIPSAVKNVVELYNATP